MEYIQKLVSLFLFPSNLGRRITYKESLFLGNVPIQLFISNVNIQEVIALF